MLAVIATAVAAAGIVLAVYFCTRSTMASITQLQSDVAAQTSVIASAVTLLQGLNAQLQAAGTDPAALAALSSTIEANTTALADAVAANTPAAAPPVPAAPATAPTTPAASGTPSGS